MGLQKSTEGTGYQYDQHNLSVCQILDSGYSSLNSQITNDGSSNWGLTIDEGKSLECTQDSLNPFLKKTSL